MKNNFHYFEWPLPCSHSFSTLDFEYWIVISIAVVSAKRRIQPTLPLPHPHNSPWSKQQIFMCKSNFMTYLYFRKAFRYFVFSVNRKGLKMSLMKPFLQPWSLQSPQRRGSVLSCERSCRHSKDWRVREQDLILQTAASTQTECCLFKAVF